MDRTEYEAMLKSAFASEFSFFLKAANFHWNVEGSDFKEYHALFGDIYGEVYGSIDTFAEELRALRIYAPASFEVFDDISQVECEDSVPSAMQMIQQLLADSDLMADMFRAAYVAADSMGDYGLANFFADRQDAHKKHSWMLRSSLK